MNIIIKFLKLSSDLRITVQKKEEAEEEQSDPYVTV